MAETRKDATGVPARERDDLESQQQIREAAVNDEAAREVAREQAALRDLHETNF